MLDTIGSFITNIETFFKSLGDFLAGMNDRETYIRLTLMILGSCLILIALWELA